MRLGYTIINGNSPLSVSEMVGRMRKMGKAEDLMNAPQRLLDSQRPQPAFSPTSSVGLLTKYRASMHPKFRQQKWEKTRCMR